MTPARRIRKNLVFKAFTEVIARALSFLFYVALARWLGEAPFGTFSLLYAVTSVVVFLVDPGVNMLMIRQAPREPEFLERSIGAIFGMKLVLCAATVIVSVSYAAAAGYGLAMAGLLALMGVQMAAFALMEYVAAIFQSQEKMQMETFLMGTGKVAVAGVAIAALYLGAQLAATLALMTLAQVLTALWALSWTARRGFDLRPVWDPGQWKILLARSIPLAGVTFFTIAFYRADVVVAPLLGLGLERIGHYSAAIKLLDVTLAVPSLCMAAAFPTLSGMAGADRAGFRRAINMTLGGLAALGLFFGGLLVAAPGSIITLVYGARFLPAAEPLMWLGAVAAFIFVRHGLLAALVLDERSKTAAGLAGLALLLNLALNVAMIPAMGIVGAAKAKLITDAALTAGAGWAWMRRAKADE